LLDKDLNIVPLGFKTNHLSNSIIIHKLDNDKNIYKFNNI